MLTTALVCLLVWFVIATLVCVAVTMLSSTISMEEEHAHTNTQ